MRRGSIHLTGDTSPSEALGVARTVLEDMGYLWVPCGCTSAVAHEGGTEFLGRRARRVRLCVVAGDGELVLERRGTGARGHPLGSGATTAMRIARHFTKARKAVAKGLHRAGLA